MATPTPKIADIALIAATLRTGGESPKRLATLALQLWEACRDELAKPKAPPFKLEWPPPSDTPMPLGEFLQAALPWLKPDARIATLRHYLESCACAEGRREDGLEPFDPGLRIAELKRDGYPRKSAFERLHTATVASRLRKFHEQSVSDSRAAAARKGAQIRSGLKKSIDSTPGAPK